MSHANSPEPPQEQSITPQAETALAPAEDHSIQMVIGRALKSRLARVGLIVAAVKPTIQAIYWCIDFYGNMQTVGELLTVFSRYLVWLFFKAIDFLNTGWGTIALMAVGFGLIALQLFLQHRRTHRTGVPSEISAERDTERGEFVDDNGRHFVDVSPAYLTGLFKKHPPEWAQVRIDMLVGQWLRLPSVVSRFYQYDGDTKASFTTEDVWGDGSGHILINLHWTKEWTERRLHVDKGDKVTIIGQIKSVNRFEIELQNCEIVDLKSTARELAEAEVTEEKHEEEVPEKRQVEGDKKPSLPGLTPAYLTDFFKRFPPEQAEKFAGTFIGHLMIVTVTVLEVRREADGTVSQVKVQILDTKGDGSNDVPVSLNFNSEARASFPSLKQGERVTVKGRLEKATAQGVTLNDCQFILPTPAELALREKMAAIENMSKGKGDTTRDPVRPTFLSPEYINDLLERRHTNPEGVRLVCKEWKGRSVEVSGRIESIEYILRNPVVYFRSPHSGYPGVVRMLFGTHWEERVKRLKTGDPILVRGEVVKFEPPDLHLEGCILIES
jgi:hypothetical protein